MTLSSQTIDKIIQHVHLWYPDWQGFDTPKFVEDELAYKWDASKKAQQLLGQQEFERLLQEDAIEEILQRIKKIGHATNLLYLSTPQTGDLRLIYASSLDKRALVEQVYDLLYGPGDSPERLQRFVDFLTANQVKPYWTFPTYFLFLIHPETDIFVKPQTFYDFYNLIDQKNEWSWDVTGKAYQRILQLAHELSEALSSYHPHDMIDIQSVVWVAAKASKEVLVSLERRQEFQRLFEAFVREYAEQGEGQWHFQFYDTSREEARANYAAILAKAEQGEEITEDVLLKLLPYADSERNRKQGAWTHPAPFVNGDVRKWFENAGWARAEDWPDIAQAIFRFVQRSVEHPEDIQETCNEFAASPYSKGLQSGALSPILNALRPEAFYIVNSKPLRTLDYLTGKKHSARIRDYPVTNQDLHRLVEELVPIMAEAYPDDTVRPADLFDAFTHWLVGKKKFDFKAATHWKIAPGENAWQWPEWVENGFAAIGWEELGDLSDVSWKEFQQRVDELARERGWTKTAMRQVWTFAKQIKEGDIIVANRDTKEVLGIGTVIGPYYFVPGVRYGHRLPVEWDDTQARRVEKPGWRRTLVKLSPEEFREILTAPAMEQELAPPFSSIFTSLDEANAGFNFLRDTLTLLGKTPEEASKRISLTFPLKYKGCVLRMNYGWWLVIDLRGPNGYDGHGITLALRDDLMADSPWAEAFPKSTTFKTDSDEPDFSLYHLPWLLPAAMDPGLRAIYEQSMRDIGRRFAHWKASPYRKYHHPEVLEAVLNPEKREALFTRGLSPKPLPEQLEEESAAQALVLLATEDDPMPAIARYLGLDEEDEAIFELNPIYTLEQMAEETGLKVALLEQWVRAIERKGQAILYGPPGTGKTFVAEHLARHLVGGGDGIIDLVQFHPAYAYEDFIQGIRPESDGDRLTYPLKPGRFLEFIGEAEQRQGISVLIIDEINRANLARVFGELMYLLEYRERTIPLAGGGKLRIPHNVRIIGAMNTADRSIALVDHALRRRFAFLALWPDYDLLRHYHQRHNTGFPVENLIQELRRLNDAIGDRHYFVGISYFLKEDLETQIEDIWRMEIEPYLEEYFFDQPTKAQSFSWERVRKQIWTP